MLRTLKYGAAALLAGASFASASAAPILIDDFQTFQTASDNTANGVAVSTIGAYAIGGNAFARTISVNQTVHAGAASRASRATVDSGELEISNDAGVNSIVDVTYNIDSLIDDIADMANAMFAVTFNDPGTGGDSSVEAFFNGASLGSQVLSQGDTLTFGFGPLLDTGNTFALRFTGSTSFDAAIGVITADVPEPAALGILGLGLLGLAGARRRKA